MNIIQELTAVSYVAINYIDEGDSWAVSHFLGHAINRLQQAGYPLQLELPLATDLPASTEECVSRLKAVVLKLDGVENLKAKLEVRRACLYLTGEQDG